MDRIIAYSDGGCRGNGKEDSLGAWAYVMTYRDRTVEMYQASEGTTNNRQELLAVIHILKRIKTTHIPIDIHVDSTYVLNGITSWIHGWKKKGWKNSKGKPVENQDLWKELDSLASKQDEIQWFKVKGHSDNEGNNRADELVNIAMDEYIENGVGSE